jgi:hypothetical protein
MASVKQLVQLNTQLEIASTSVLDNDEKDNDYIGIINKTEPESKAVIKSAPFERPIKPA